MGGAVAGAWVGRVTSLETRVHELQQLVETNKQHLKNASETISNMNNLNNDRFRMLEQKVKELEKARSKGD